MADPYIEFHSTLSESLQSLQSLHHAHLQLLASLPSAKALDYSTTELQGTLSAAQIDLDAVDELVAFLEETPDRRVAKAEIQTRRAFVERVRVELKRIRKSLPSHQVRFHRS